MEKVKICDVPVVDVEFLDDAAKGEALSKILPHTISSWGAPRHVLSATEETDFATQAFEKGKVQGMRGYVPTRPFAAASGNLFVQMWAR